MSSNDKDMFTWMVIEELMDLDMEPRPVTLWWTSTYKADGGKTLQVGGKGKSWEMPFVEEFDPLGYRFPKNGKGAKKLGRY